MVDRFFTTRPEWAHQKHRILGGYLTAWARKLGSRSDELAFVDLCAGAGQYEDGAFGSPMIAAEVNSELARRDKRLVVYACEASKETAESLERSLAPYAQQVPPRAVVHPVPFQDILPDLLSRTREVPTLLFLDPYGVRSLRSADLRPILVDVGRESTELLVRVPPRALSRMAGWLASRPRKASAQKTAEGCRILLRQLGIDRALLEEAAAVDEYSAPPSADRLFASYLNKFRERFTHVRGYPIRPQSDQAARYFLVHCTDHPDGVLIMNDVASVAEDRLFEETERRRDEGQITLFEPEREPATSMREAAEQLIPQLSPGCHIHYRELRLRLVEAFGTDLRKKHHDAIIDRLEESGQIRVVSGSKRENRTYRVPQPRLFSAPESPGIRPRSVRRATSRPPSASGHRPA